MLDHSHSHPLLSGRGLGGGDGTPTKSLNASFSHMNIFSSNIYGATNQPSNMNKNLNLSGFLFDNNSSRINMQPLYSMALAAANNNASGTSPKRSES